MVMFIKQLRVVGTLDGCPSPRNVMVAWKEFGVNWKKVDVTFRPYRRTTKTVTFPVPVPITHIRIRNAGGTFRGRAYVTLQGVFSNKIAIIQNAPRRCYGIVDRTYSV